MKLKDLLLEKPADYVDGNADDIIKLLRRKKKYDQFDGVGPSESHHDKKEGKMAKYDAKEIAEDAVAVFKMIDKDMDLPEWLEAKITKSADYMNSVKDYLTHHMKSDDSDNENQSQKEGTCGYGVDGKLGEEPAGAHLIKKKLLKSKKKFDLDEACQKGYMTHPTRKTKIMFGKRYRNCVKKEGVDTTVTLEQAGMIADNICVNCGDFTNENLRKWFKDKWVNIGKKNKDGSHPPCGSSGKKRGYAKCVPASKARGMSKKQKASATRRKRAAQNKAGRGGTSSLRGGGKAPIRVSTKPKK